MSRLRSFPRYVRAGFLLLAVAAVSPVAMAEEGAEVFGDTSRIVVIGGSVAEITYALGEEAKLAARDSTSVYPEAVQELPDVGYMRALSPEGVLSVNPSGILALEGSGPREAVDVLKKASIPFIEVPETFDRAGILEKIRIVGKALGVDEKAAELSAKVDADLGEAQKLTADIHDRKRVLFILSMQGGKVLASGTGTAANGIIELAGGVNAMGEFPGYKQLSDEAVILAKPDVILMMDRGDGDHEIADAELLAHPAIASTPAGEGGRIVRMDGNYLLGFGPRTADAVRDLAATLYSNQIKG